MDYYYFILSLTTQIPSAKNESSNVSLCLGALTLLETDPTHVTSNDKQPV